MANSVFEDLFNEGMRRINDLKAEYNAPDIDVVTLERLDSIRDAKTASEGQEILNKAVNRYQIRCLSMWARGEIPGPKRNVKPLTEWEKLERDAKKEANCAARLEGKGNFVAAEKHRKLAEKIYRSAAKLKAKMAKEEAKRARG